MERIAVVTKDGAIIKNYLEANMDNIDVEVFNDIFLFHRRVTQSPLRVDTLLIKDDGMRDSINGAFRLEDAATRLMEILRDMPLVEIERVIYLNLTKNPKHKEVMEFIAGSKDIKAKIIIATRESYQIVMVKDILLKNSQTFEGVEMKYKYVVRNKRGRTLKSKYLADFETDKAVVLEHSSYTDIDKDNIELKHIFGQDVLKVEDISDATQLDNLELDDSVTDTIEEKKTQIVAVVGESKSGATTTSAILGASGSSFGKTLMIDMNYNNLGLSYIAEKVLIESEINNIGIRNIVVIDDGVKKLREQIFDKRQLHIVTNSMPVKEHLSHIEFGFFVNNLIRLYKNSYRFIILDIPIDEIEMYSHILPYVDKVIMCTPPYMNNIVSLFEKVSESQLLNSDAFMEVVDDTFKNVICFRTKVFSRVNREIKQVKLETINRYATALLGQKVKVTGVFRYNPTTYLDTILFQQLIDV